MGYQGEGEGDGEVVNEPIWLVVGEELGNWIGKKNGREFGEVERKVTEKIGKWKFGGTQDVCRYIYPVGEVSDGEEGVGKEVHTCIQAEKAHDNGIDNKVAGMEFHW